MGYIVLNCRDLEQRNKAIARCKAAGMRVNREPDDSELQLWLRNSRSRYDFGYDTVDQTYADYAVHTKIKTFIEAFKSTKE